MVEQFQGQVTQISAKDWSDKGKNIVLYSFQISGSPRWFRTGTNQPGFSEGSNVSFTADDNGNVQPRKAPEITVSEGGATSSPPAPSTQRSSQGATSRDDYWGNKEAKDAEKDKRYQEQDIPRMTFSAAQDRAVTLVAAALAHDGLSFGSMAKGKKLDYIMGCVQEVTNTFFLDAINSPERLQYLREDAAQETASEDMGPEQNEEYS